MYGTINGSTFNFDVQTKAILVKNTLEAFKKVDKTLPKDKIVTAINDIYIKISKMYGVTIPSIKAWIKTYYYTHSEYLDTTPGTMRMATVLVNGAEDIATVRNMLSEQKQARIDLSRSLDPDYDRKKGITYSLKDIEELKGI